ncbi:DUF2946 family protein [Herbaspirillum sp. WKF16]|uniref:DUF2946 family protein n=1 Tax=Herbaspirillum sp. WKF16 TaxID=3028312 RepID=UPI0023A98FBA|nr:DUF2946 family protein [Herbaspirillum sp. WKF16]WDZ96684.1 DUF2946 family protein [Herbaspirillum sp. WKF16]
MKMSAPAQRLVSWITIASILALLWSGMAHARTAGDARAAPWGDICSAAADQGKTQDDGQPGGAHVGHCMFCSKQDMAHALPARFDHLPPQPAPATRAPASRASAAAVPQAWLPPHPRGPPVLSL